MKKKLTTLLMLLLCVCSGAWADAVTFGYGEGNVSISSMRSDGKDSAPTSVQSADSKVTFAIFNGPSSGNVTQNSSKLKFQNTTYMTVSCASGYTISQIVIVTNESNRGFTASEESFSRDGATSTWTGTSTSVTFTNSSSNNLNVTSVAVTYSVASSVSTPTFDPTSGTLLRNSGTVTATSSTTGSTVYYKWSASSTKETFTYATAAADGWTAGTAGDAEATATAPNEEGTFYLNAVAYKDSEASSVANQAFTVADKKLSSVTVNGAAISSDDLATLKSTHSLSVDGSALNGIGMIGVTVTIGDAPAVTRANTGDDAVFTFTYNEVDYTVTVTDVKRTYTAQGSIISFDSEKLSNENKVLTVNDIVFNHGTKQIQYGAGTVTISGTQHQAIKLSTGAAMDVSFPAGKKAKKIIVYGWAANGDGWLKTLGETSSANMIFNNVAYDDGDKFNATCAATDIYPSVYEYDLGNYGGLWSSAYFYGASVTGTNPFVVMDFVFADAPAITTQPVSANYVKNAAATALSVAAISSSPQACTYQWYRCNDAAGNGASAIEGETSATYTPSTATAGVFYYFCRVGEAAGGSANTTDSEVVNIKVTATIANTMFTLTMSYSGNSAVNVNHGSTIDLGEYGTATGGTVKIGNKHASDDTKAQITNTGDGTVYFGGNDAYIKIELTNALKEGDVITFTPGSGTRQVCFTTTDSRDATYATSSNTYTCGDAFDGATTLYVWRKETSATYLHAMTISRKSTANLTTNVGGWTSFTPEWNATLSDGATAYIITAVGTSTVTVEEVTTLEVGKGYFINGTASTSYTATATTEDADDTTGSLLVGCPTSTALTEASPAGNKYVLGHYTEAEQQKAGLFLVDSDVTVGAGKAYVNAGVNGGARALTFVGDDETTGIKATRTVIIDQMAGAEVYNLNGQRVAQPTKGLYIVNGRKVVIR